jgi:uncharacterized protein (TIGR02147 family)
MKKKNRTTDPGLGIAPEIFRYHDYRAFLADWLAFQKASQSGFSLRGLAKSAGLASGYLPMVLSGKRPLTGKALDKLLPFLSLNASERGYLENLTTLGTSDSHEARIEALERMKRFLKYKKNNHRETEVYQYLTHWYYIVIREMACLKEFKLDAEWIQSRLRTSVPLKEIKDAIEFLTKNEYLKPDGHGGVRPPEVALSCEGGVYRVALTKFHREIFELAGKAIDNTPSTERNIQGHTFALDQKNYEKVREIIEETMKKIRDLSVSEVSGDEVYHLEVALFPLTLLPNQRRKIK